MRMKAILLIFLSFYLCNALAGNRPTLTFNGENYYLAKARYDTDYTHSPVNVVETYLLEGETSDNFTKSIERATYLQINDFKASLKARLYEYQQDNKDIPFELTTENGKEVLKVTFWWPFRPLVALKQIYVFQEDKVSHTAMSYIISELQFFDLKKTTNADLVKEGKGLLLSDEIAKAASNLSF